MHKAEKEGKEKKIHTSQMKKTKIPNYPLRDSQNEASQPAVPLSRLISCQLLTQELAE